MRPFPSATISDMYHYFIPIKKADYIVLHVATNDTVDTELSVIVDKLLKLKCFVNEKLPNCKIVLSRPTQRADDSKLSMV